MNLTKQKQQIRLIIPPLIVLSNILIFQVSKYLWEVRWGYLAGFCFYWICWCLLFSFWIIGPKNIKSIYQFKKDALSPKIGLLIPLLTIFPVMTFIASFLPFFRHAGAGIILLAFLFALINGIAEELLWRGALVAAYPSGIWRGYLYPTLFFGAWHIAPELVLPNPLSGGALSFIGGALVMGLAWGWIAWRSRSILLTTISHILTNFFGFVGFIYMNWMR
jgi:membrane protease YdiL (CAAX protease family)